MNVLGIETSCDETSASIVSNGKKILSNCVSTSLHLHKKHGGIIPEIASRMQLETIAEVTDEALQASRIPLRSIGLISVTGSPGLLGSLLVGISFARAVSAALKVPCLEIDHLNAHIYSAFLNDTIPALPVIALVVSGGHTSLYMVKKFDNILLLGQTQDDACGEAFDKVAKLLNLGYPGGPVIEQWGSSGDPRKIKFNCSNTKNPYDFSFSGIKTAVRYYLSDRVGEENIKTFLPKKHKKLTADICACFQESVINALAQKALRCCLDHKISSLCVVGGVSANGALRKKCSDLLGRHKIQSYFPLKKLCTDNAAMVAGLGFHLYSSKGGALC